MRGRFFTVLALLLPLSCGRDAATVETRQCDDPAQGFDRPHAALGTAISEELAGLSGHPWAGNYYAGDGLGFNQVLELAPRSGFRFVQSGCGGVYGHNIGAVVESDGVLALLAAEVQPQDNPNLTAPTRLHVVQWGQRTYLLRPAELVALCNAINGGGEPRISHRGFFLLRMDDDDKPAGTLSGIPDEFRHYILDRPLVAKVTHVGASRPAGSDGDERQAAIELDVGRNHGVFEGMELYLTKSDAPQQVVVTDVRDTSSTAAWRMLLSPPDAHPVRPGAELSSRMPWADVVSGPLKAPDSSGPANESEPHIP